MEIASQKIRVHRANLTLQVMNVGRRQAFTTMIFVIAIIAVGPTALWAQKAAPLDLRSVLLLHEARVSAQEGDPAAASRALATVRLANPRADVQAPALNGGGQPASPIPLPPLHEQTTFQLEQRLRADPTNQEVRQILLERARRDGDQAAIKRHESVLAAQRGKNAPQVWKILLALVVFVTLVWQSTLLATEVGPWCLRQVHQTFGPVVAKVLARIFARRRGLDGPAHHSM